MSTVLFIFNQNDEDVVNALWRPTNVEYLTQLMEDTIRHSFQDTAECDERLEVVINFPEDKAEYLFGATNASAAQKAVESWNGYVQRDFASVLGEYISECARSDEPCLDNMLTHRLAMTSASLDNQASIRSQRIVLNCTTGVMGTVLSKTEKAFLVENPALVAIAQVTCQPA